MSQVINHPNMARGHHTIIFDELYSRYTTNLVWPILWYHNGTLLFITFEVNENNNTNSTITSTHPILDYLPNEIEVYKVDYTNGNIITPFRETTNLDIVRSSARPQFRNSHEYVTSPFVNYNTIDIDYLWISDGNVKGLEITTLFVPMISKEKALNLLNGIIMKRKGLPLQLSNLERNPFNATMNMAIINNYKGTTNLIPDSNVLLFDLNRSNVDIIRNRQLPMDISFIEMEEFLSIL